MKKTGLTGQDQHDLNKVSRTLKEDTQQKGSKNFFKGINDTRNNAHSKKEE